MKENPHLEGLQTMKHAHNQYMQTFATSGLTGLLALLAIFICHGWLFAKHMAARYPQEIRDLAFAGVLLVIVYAILSITGVPFDRKKHILLYGFSSASLWGGIMGALKHRKPLQSQ